MTDGLAFAERLVNSTELIDEPGQTVGRASGDDF